MTVRKALHKGMLFSILLLFGGVGEGLFCSCTSTPYEAGDGEYSYMCADFATVKTNADAQMESFLTDDNKSLRLTSPRKVEGAKADTTYRALVYYDVNGTDEVQLRSMRGISVCHPFKPSEDKPMLTAPTGWESMWLSKNKSYINLAINLLVGIDNNIEEQQQHVLGVCQDSVVGRHTYYTLYHDQHGVPEYYTLKTYLSIPISKDAQSGDAFTLTVNTYKGLKQKTLILP